VALLWRQLLLLQMLRYRLVVVLPVLVKVV